MSFEAIYADYWQRVFRLCMGYVNDHDLAKDLAQDTFIAVWQQLPSFRQEAAIGTWIYRIAANICLRHIEKIKRHPKAPWPANLKEEHAENHEPRIQFLYRCIAELPELDRIIIGLELENVKQAEIATIVGITDANVRVRLHRIKEKITQKFKNNGFFNN